MAKEKDDIERYREGSLSKAERHALEKKALSDPFLADALEGAETVSPDEFSADLKEFSKKLHSRQSTTWFTPLRIAAGIIILISAGSLFYYLSPSEPPTLALEKSAGSPQKSDSILKAQKDSTSTLLTMAKAEEREHETKPSAPKSSIKNSAKTDQANISDATKSTGDIQITEAKPVPEEKVEEEKLKIAATEISEDKDKKEVVNEAATQSLASGAGADNKKESAGLGHAAGLRRAKLKEAQSKAAEVMQPIVTNTQQNIAGKVTSVEDGSSLPGVNVGVKGSSEGTVTDSEGNYQLNTQVSNPQLLFSFIGMQTKEVSVNSQGPVNVQMSLDEKQLSEVVVSAYGISKDDDVIGGEIVIPEKELAQPMGGKESFQKYLLTNLHYPAKAIANKTEGKVTVQFTVNPDGSIHDFTVIKGIGDGCDEELIRLIREGPKWLPTRRNKIALEDKVKVRLRFSIAR